MYNADLPITSQKDDMLGRASYASNLAQTIIKYGIVDSLCIGLLGPWGSGKTSLLNMVLEEIEKANTSENEKLLILRFEPWNFATTDQLLNQFFILLSNTLLSEKDKKKSQLSEAIEEYADALDVFELVPYVGKPLASIGKSGAKFSSRKLNKGTARKDIQKQREIVENLLRKFDKKLLVVIDDIDRLSNDQIRQVFQLVNAVAKFPNTIYLLVFDRDVVIKALEKVQEGNGNAYLEKVIQVPLSIPDTIREKREKVLFGKLDEIIRTYNIQFESDYWRKIFFSCIRPYIQSLREVNRLTNLLQFKLAFINQEVNFSDMVALTTLEISYPIIYDWIKHNKDILTGSWDDDTRFINRFKTEEQEAYKLCQEELNNLLGDKLVSTSRDELDRICSSIKVLFPYWCKKSVNRKTLDELRHANHLSHPDKFVRYFNLDLDEVVVRKKDIESTLHIYSCKEIGDYMKRLDEDKHLDEFLYEIGAQNKELIDVRAKILVTALLQYGNQFHSQSTHSMFAISTSELAENLAHEIMATHMECKWGQFLLELLESADWNMLLGISYIIHIMFLAYGKYIDPNPRLEYERIITEAELLLLEKAFLKRIKENIANYDLLSYPQGGRPFMLLKYIDKEYVKEYLATALTIPENIVRFLSLSITQWTGTETSYELRNEYQDYVNDEDVKTAIVSCVKNGTLYSLSEYAQSSSAVFFLVKISKLTDTYNNRTSQKAVDHLLDKWKNGLMET